MAHLCELSVDRGPLEDLVARVDGCIGDRVGDQAPHVREATQSVFETPALVDGNPEADQSLGLTDQRQDDSLAFRRSRL